jgi:hypothetical protein
MKLENPKKHYKKRGKENIWITYYGCRVIFTKIARISHGAFFKQHPKSDIIFFNTFNGTKRIELHKGGGNTKPKVMKEL